MIQRIQTIWLSLCVIISLFLLNNRLIEFIGHNREKITLGFRGLSTDSGNGVQVLSQATPLFLTILIIPLFSLIAIFLFRKRSFQKMAVMVVMVAGILLCLELAYYWHFTARTFNAGIVSGMKIALPPVIIILAVLALLGIRKDEKLVKSYDRLR